RAYIVGNRHGGKDIVGHPPVVIDLCRESVVQDPKFNTDIGLCRFFPAQFGIRDARRSGRGMCLFVLSEDGAVEVWIHYRDGGFGIDLLIADLTPACAKLQAVQDILVSHEGLSGEIPSYRKRREIS